MYIYIETCSVCSYVRDDNVVNIRSGGVDIDLDGTHSAESVNLVVDNVVELVVEIRTKSNRY